MVYRRVKTVKKRRFQKRTRKQRGGENNNNTQSASNIFPLNGKTERAQKAILERLASALEKRPKNYLVFFAKYGNPQEKERFQDTKWVFSDLHDNSHERDNNDRLLIQLDYNNENDVKRMLNRCTECFDYITFDGAIADKMNITEDLVESFLKALKPGGMLAAAASNSEIKESGDGYQAAVVNLPRGIVPVGSGTKPYDFPISQLRSLIGLMLKARRMGVPFQDDIQKLANDIDFANFKPDCMRRHGYWYANDPRLATTIQEEEICKEHEGKIKERVEREKTAEQKTNFADLKYKLLSQMIAAFQIPVFEEPEEGESVSDDGEDTYVLIKKDQ